MTTCPSQHYENILFKGFDNGVFDAYEIHTASIEEEVEEAPADAGKESDDDPTYQDTNSSNSDDDKNPPKKAPRKRRVSSKETVSKKKGKSADLQTGKKGVVESTEGVVSKYKEVHSERTKMVFHKTCKAVDYVEFDKLSKSYDKAGVGRKTVFGLTKFPQQTPSHKTSAKYEYVNQAVTYVSTVTGMFELCFVTNQGRENLFKKVLESHSIFGKQTPRTDLEAFERKTSNFDGLSPDDPRQLWSYPMWQFSCPKYASFSCGPATNEPEVCHFLALMLGYIMYPSSIIYIYTDAKCK